MRIARYAAPAASLLILAACGRGDDKAAGDFDEALAGLHLTEATADSLTWESYKRDGDKAVFRNLTLTADEDDADDGEAGESTIAMLTVENPRMDGDAPVFDSWDMQNFSGGGEDARLSVAHISLTDANPAMVRLILNSWDDEDDDDGADDIDDTLVSELAFGGFQLEDLSLSFDDENGAGEMTLASINMAGLEDGRMQSATLNNLSFSGKFADEDTGEMTPVSFTLARMDANNIYARSMDAFMLADRDDDEGFAQLMKRMQKDQRQGDFDMDGTVEDMTADIAGLKFDLPRMSFSNQTKGDRLVSSSDIPDMTLGYDDSGRLGEQIGKFADMFGYQTLRFSMHNEQVWDRKADRLMVKDSWMEMEDGFRSETTLDLDGYGAYSEAVSEKAMQAGEADQGFKLADLPLDKVKLREFRFRLEDKGLADNIFNGVGEMQGQDPQTVRAQAIGMVALMSAFAPPNTPRAQLTELSTALTQFLQTPGTLTISMEPDEPLPLSDVVNEDGTYDVAPLNFSAESEAP